MSEKRQLNVLSSGDHGMPLHFFAKNIVFPMLNPIEIK